MINFKFKTLTGGNIGESFLKIKSAKLGTFGDMGTKKMFWLKNEIRGANKLKYQSV